MGSLFRLLFETMSFSGACDTVGCTPDTVGIGSVGDHLRYVEPSQIGNMRHEVPNYAKEARDAVETWDWDLWGFTVSSDAPTIKDITCRVRDDDMKAYVVLDTLEYGCADLEHQGTFRKEVDVTAFGKKFSLPLDAAARLACFVTHGCENWGTDPHWPLEARHDVGIVQLFVYDLDIFSGAFTPLTMLPPGHPDIAERDKFLDACKQMSAATPATTPVPGLLFTDDLWQLKASQIAEVIGGGWLVDGGLSKVVLGATTIRVAIVCSFVPCKETSDYQPGRPGGVGRLYPHIMVRGTAPLTRVLAGVRFTRPARTTIKEGLPCGCDEMEGDIGSLLVADANDGNMQYLGGLPIPYWNNLFNYYAPVETGSSLLGRPIVAVKHDAPPDRFEDAIRRKTSRNERTVTRVKRQGAFDNLHMAPRMRMPKVTRIHKGGSHYSDGVDVDEDVRERFQMNKIVMAPFCVHDCFHIHWRWAENSEPGTFGWGSGRSAGSGPSTVPGQPMVPWNQDVRVRVDAPNVATYEATVLDAGTSGWHTVLHHGAAYLVHAGIAMDAGRAAFANDQSDAPIVIDPSNAEFYNGGTPVLPTDSWATFYWLARYFMLDGQALTSATPEERIVILDLERLLKVGP